MAFLKDNQFQEGNSEEYFLTRTNPLANSANAEILKVTSCGSCDIELDVEITTGMGSTVVDFASPTSGYDTNFIKVTITDRRGNFATNVDSGTVSAITVDTSQLDFSGLWEIKIVIELKANVVVECPCSKIYSFDYNPLVGIDINTETMNAPVLAVYEVGGTTPITSIDLGTFAAGTTEPFELVLKNNGMSVLTIELPLTIGADVLTATLPNFGEIVFPQGTILLSGTVDTSLAAGAQSGTVDIVSDGGTETITINYTIA
jgi:hypothetical protein